MASNDMKARCTKFFADAIKEVQEQTAIQLGYLGEDLVNKNRIRSKEDSWTDRTGNLRSSIGASVVVGGKEYFRTDFQQVKDGEEGVRKGNELLDTEATLHKQDYALIVVAGMEYASYLEEFHHRDVLASTELQARQEIGSYLQDAIDGALTRINRWKI